MAIMDELVYIIFQFVSIIINIIYAYRQTDR